MNKKSKNPNSTKHDDLGIKEEESKNCEEIDDESKDLNSKEDKTSCDERGEEIDKYKQDIDKYEKEIEVLKDRLFRTIAEYDNFRKRSQKEKENIYTDVCEDVLKLLLPVFDNLERANSVSDGFDELKKGIELTVKQFKEALKKLNVEEIDTNSKFDPYLHEAVMHCEDGNYGEKEIIEVFMKGYKRGDKILRHSMVKVAN